MSESVPRPGMFAKVHNRRGVVAAWSMNGT